MLKFVPTPIGNLEDISIRALKALETAEIIFAEDTRVTKKLLSLLSEKFQIKPQVEKYISLHSHNEKSIYNFEKSIFDRDVIYVSDAGMPAISDPGAILVDFCIKNKIDYEVLAGANALLVAYAMSGFLDKEFQFYAFLPHKGSERSKKLEKIINSNSISILYESPHRLIKLLEELNKLIPNREIFLVKEISKMYQKSWRAEAKDILEIFKNVNIKGEWVVVIDKSENLLNGEITQKDIIELNLPPKTKAKLLSKISNKTIKEWYNELSNLD